jgi:hypothetical protein
MTSRPSDPIREIPLNDLPRHNAWIKRLLGLEPTRRYEKSHESVWREWEADRWGPLLSVVRTRPGTTVREAEELVSSHEGHPADACLLKGGTLRCMPAELAAEFHFETLAAAVEEHVSAASAVADLGAGFGGKILRLAARPAFRDKPLYAAELTPSGRELIALLARNAGLEISVGPCDFRSLSLGIELPPGAVIFTSYATASVPELPEDFPRFLAGLAPSYVVHFEPVFEHCDESTLIGLLSKRYIELNDYNRNLLTVLRRAESDGHLEIVKEEPAVEGVNPLMPASLLVWRPRV